MVIALRDYIDNMYLRLVANSDYYQFTINRAKEFEVIKPKPPSATCDKFLVRFNADGLRKELKVRAAQNERSLNAEILYLIKRGMAAEQGAKQ